MFSYMLLDYHLRLRAPCCRLELSDSFGFSPHSQKLSDVLISSCCHVNIYLQLQLQLIFLFISSHRCVYLLLCTFLLLML